MRIRNGTESDVPWLLGQLREFAAFFGSKYPLFDEEHARAILPNFIANHLLLVAEDDAGSPAGFLGAYVMLHPFNPKIKTLAEVFWWVDRSRRGGRAALMLLDEYVRIGRATATWVTMALESRSPVNEDTLKSDKVQIERKTFVFTLKENPRGRFLRITEDVGGRRDTIIIPAPGLDDFKKLLEEMVKASNEIPPKQA